MSDSLVLFSSDDEEASHSEVKLYNNLKAMLKGVPPPSSVTISKLTVEEMLKKYRENIGSSGFGLNVNNPPPQSEIMNKKKSAPWLNYANSSHLSEEIASLMQKVQERYIQMETMSSCNIWFDSTVKSCGSTKKRARVRQGNGLSPGRRLSHLARRRQFFSSENLQRLADNNNVRQIEIRKNDRREERKKGNRIVIDEKLKSSKRALFLSPETETPTKYGNIGHVKRTLFSQSNEEHKKQPLQENSKLLEVSRWLSQQNFETELPKKRLREDCSSQGGKRKCPRRLNFGNEEVVNQSKVNSFVNNSSFIRKPASVFSSKLSQIHKNKLLWAVSVVLKENNIKRDDKNFKSCASTLFHTCRKNLDEILELPIDSGTSDKILYFARKNISFILKDLGVIKGMETISKEKLPGGLHELGNNPQTDSEMKDDLKENIDENNTVNIKGSTVTENANNLDFFFKTPKKRPKRGKIKSCHKQSEKSRKSNLRRKWRSLELLTDNEAVDTSIIPLGTNIKKLKDNITNINKNSLNDEILRPSPASSGSKILDQNLYVGQTKILLSGTPLSHLNEESSVSVSIPRLEDSVLSVFSPIPSSVKEDFQSPPYHFPALYEASTYTERLEGSVVDDHETVTDSSVISNQDSEMNSKICFLRFSEHMKDCSNVSKEMEKISAEPSIGTTIKLNNLGKNGPIVSSNIVDVPEGKSEKIDELDGSLHRSEDLKPYMKSILEFKNKSQINSSNSVTDSIATTKCNSADKYDNEPQDFNQILKLQDATMDDELVEVTHTAEVAFEEGTYKPRKLVVKKSKPNWKVIRQNSQEGGNESNLRLKMRLSHEWEIVGRNSSCSDIGNNSECEVNSLNCSQISSTNDERDFSSEIEQDEDLHVLPKTKFLNERGNNLYNDYVSNDSSKMQPPVFKGLNNSEEFCDFKMKYVNSDDNVSLKKIRNHTSNITDCASKSKAVNSDHISPSTSNSSVGISENCDNNCPKRMNNYVVFDGNLIKKCSDVKSLDPPKNVEAEELKSKCHYLNTLTEMQLASDNISLNSEHKNESRDEDTKNPSCAGASPVVIGYGNTSPHAIESKYTTDSSSDFNNSSDCTGKCEILNCSKSYVREGVVSPVLFGHFRSSKDKPNLKVIDREAKNESENNGMSNGSDFPGHSEPSDGECSRYVDPHISDRLIISPRPRKKLLTLENYKARKHKGSEINISEKHSSLDIFPNDMRGINYEKNYPDGTAKKKIYNIRLKHPVRHHKHRRKNKLSRKEHGKNKMTDMLDGTEFDDFCESSIANESCIRSPCSNNKVRDVNYFDNPPGEVNSVESVSKSPLLNMMKGETSKRGSQMKSDKTDANIQAIVNALSTLSNLVEQQINIENEKMTLKKCKTRENQPMDNGDQGEYTRSAWLDIVSSWCDRNLSHFAPKSDTVSNIGQRNSNEERPDDYHSKGIFTGGNSVIQESVSPSAPIPAQYVYHFENDSSVVKNCDKSLNDACCVSDPPVCTSSDCTGTNTSSLSEAVNDSYYHTLPRKEEEHYRSEGKKVLPAKSPDPRVSSVNDVDFCPGYSFSGSEVYNFSGSNRCIDEPSRKIFSSSYPEILLEDGGDHTCEKSKNVGEKLGNLNEPEKMNIRQERIADSTQSVPQTVFESHSEDSKGVAQPPDLLVGFTTAGHIISQASLPQDPIRTIYHGYLSGHKSVTALYPSTLACAPWHCPQDVSPWNYAYAMGVNLQNATYYQPQFSNVSYYFNNY